MRAAIEALNVAENTVNYPLSSAGVTQCMRAVLDFYDLIPISGYGSAQDGWKLTKDKRYDRSPLAGAPVYFTGGKYGHTALATGVGENCRSTGMSGTKMFDTTISELEKLTKDHYAGWGADFSGRVIDFTNTADNDSKPFVPPTNSMKRVTMFLIATSIDDVNPPFNRWIVDPSTGTRRNINEDDWKLYIKIGIPEPEPGVQPSDRLSRPGASYRQIW